MSKSEPKSESKSEPKSEPDEISATLPLPAGLLGVLRQLRGAGFQAWLVGEPLQALLRGDLPLGFELATSANATQLLELFPSAVPTHAISGIVTIPAAAGPVDAAGFRNGAKVTDDLAHRDFTLNAMAYDPVDDRFLDPFSGRSDLGQGRLRCAGSAEARLAEDPLRALRAARLVGTLPLRADRELEQAMGQWAPLLAQVDPGRLRRELSRLLLAPRVSAALALLRRTGLEEVLAPGARADAGELVESLPQSLPLRLAAWLRGAQPSALLRRLRFGHARSKRVLRLLEHHPLDTTIDPTRDPSVRRLLRGLPEDDLAGLFQMREWELTREKNGDARAELDSLRRAIVRVRANDEHKRRRIQLALGGRGVMEVLGCGPGPRIGLALAYLAKRVVDDPGCNTPEGLRSLLNGWSETHPSHRG
jgi:tRNA nucleotidyltransferase (CCA-adding enzyme)